MEISNRYHATAFCARKTKKAKTATTQEHISWNPRNLLSADLLAFEPNRGTLKMEYSPDSDTFKIRGSLDKADINTEGIDKRIEEIVEEVKRDKSGMTQRNTSWALKPQIGASEAYSGSLKIEYPSGQFKSIGEGSPKIRLSEEKIQKLKGFLEVLTQKPPKKI